MEALRYPPDNEKWSKEHALDRAIDKVIELESKQGNSKSDLGYRSQRVLQQYGGTRNAFSRSHSQLTALEDDQEDPVLDNR